MNLKQKLFAVPALLLGLVAAAHAELPAAVTTTVNGVKADGQAMFDLVFPVIGLFLGLGIVIKLFKRFTNKV